MSDRVWVTGMGAVTPGGWSVERTWETVRDGGSGVRPVRRFATFPSSSSVAGMVPGHDEYLPEYSLSVSYGTHAAREALAGSGLDEASGLDAAIVANHGERRLPGEGASGRVAGVEQIAREVGASVGARRSSAPYGACAGSAQAIGMARRLITSGRADTVLAGGSDALVTPFDFFSFSSLYVMSTRECPAEEASCPFDERRDGFVLAEGAAFLLLESERHARARGAEPLAFLDGFGLRQNAHHMFAPPPDGQGPADAMAEALRDAGTAPSGIDHINAHGTGTRDNDSSETLAIRSVFGAHADELTVTSNKSQLGHTMGACGAIEAVLSVMSLRTGVVPPTRNLERPSPECDLDYVPGSAREVPLRRVLSNSFGFGGHSASLVLSLTDFRGDA
ncbi:beta-ketoacyl-[acyl-carrier-protein] synthase family protein [Nocardiopsis alborubida]|uniref:Beta-ketoacyl-[acyl-carrier-protein] synthase family protein n=1 Tax=Nocardiopsis alborubida TaxID=146802 RepID=A0A7X6M9R2_9ACTN|nr:beta-ketoacyl-[acyl-carrier-protein] synthase family protein [Nocardiopsis alborubida]NKY97206.1 beta-ketoacyl-[acyl-carrier-protein] synthase family protein [Nocardiopsis alborubida]